jgi:hypothetical protein
VAGLGGTDDPDDTHGRHSPVPRTAPGAYSRRRAGRRRVSGLYAGHVSAVSQPDGTRQVSRGAGRDALCAVLVRVVPGELEPGFVYPTTT